MTTTEQSSSTRCWWCHGELVGPAGIKGRLPLFYREVTLLDGHLVRVHAKCQEEAREAVMKGEA